MRLREAVASALQLIAVLAFLILGAFLIMLPSRPDWRLAAVKWLQERPESFYGAGFFIGSFGLLLMLGFYGVGRGHFLRLAMKPNAITVDVKLVEQAIEECFKTNFPLYVRGADITVISKKHLEIAVDLEPLNENRQLRLMKVMEKKLSLLLCDRFGYTRPFTLSIHSR